MHSPYHLLNIGKQADDAEIKQAYLQQIKNHPPERDPRRFHEIQQAYELIKDSESRLRYELFHWPTLEFEQLIDHAFQRNNASQPISVDNFLKLFNPTGFDQTLAKKYPKPL